MLYMVVGTTKWRCSRIMCPGMLWLCILLCAAGPFGLFFGGDSGGQTGVAYAAAQSYQRLQLKHPFMYRPYYGPKTVLQRTVSFMDHDKPWYEDDNVVVRYDGATWRGAASTVSDCYTRVSCYDGHNGYDLDMAFEPVLSVASGRVIRAGWYNPLDHNSSFGLWVAIDHGNGLVSAYGHLSAVLVSVGDHVRAQWQIGTSGTTGASTGPHLHFSTFYLSKWQATDPFGWQGRQTDPNIVPDSFLWMKAPKARTQSPDLGGSAAYKGAIMVDDGHHGWSSTGNWWTSRYRTDVNGSLHYAATSSGRSSSTATWRPVIPASGYYEVGAYIDDTHDTSGWMPYTIYSSAPNRSRAQIVHTVHVDASHIGVFVSPYGVVKTGPRWVSLGTYYFRRGTSSCVVLSNATGEDGEQIAADAIEFVRTKG